MIVNSHVRSLERRAEMRERATYGDRFTHTALRRTVERAIARLNLDRKERDEKPMPKWSPYRLRHSAITRIRTEFGIEAAKAVGGHASAAMTESYSVEAERELARRTMAKLG